MSKHQTLQQRIEEFFTNNPHEWMSMEDLAVKFGRPMSSVEQAIGRLRRSGFYIESVIVYRKREDEVA